MEKNDTETPASGTAGTAASVDECFGVRWRINLHNEVDRWNVESPRSDVGGKENSGGCGGSKAGEIFLAGIGRMFSMKRDEEEFIS
jgi:hypothetical protein